MMLAANDDGERGGQSADCISRNSTNHPYSTDSELGRLTYASGYQESQVDEEDPIVATEEYSCCSYYCEEETQPDRASVDHLSNNDSSNNDVANLDYSELITTRFQQLYGFRTPVKNCHVLDDDWCDQIFAGNTVADSCTNMIFKNSESQHSRPISPESLTDKISKKDLDRLETTTNTVWYTFMNDDSSKIHSANQNFAGAEKSKGTDEKKGKEDLTNTFPHHFQCDSTEGQTGDEENHVYSSSEWPVTEELLDHPFKFFCLINELAAVNDLVVVTNVMDTCPLLRTDDKCIIKEIDFNDNSDTENVCTTDTKYMADAPKDEIKDRSDQAMIDTKSMIGTSIVPLSERENEEGITLISRPITEEREMEDPSHIHPEARAEPASYRVIEGSRNNSNFDGNVRNNEYGITNESSCAKNPSGKINFKSPRSLSKSSHSGNQISADNDTILIKSTTHRRKLYKNRNPVQKQLASQLQKVIKVQKSSSSLPKTMTSSSADKETCTETAAMFPKQEKDILEINWCSESKQFLRHRKEAKIRRHMTDKFGHEEKSLPQNDPDKSNKIKLPAIRVNNLWQHNDAKPPIFKDSQDQVSRSYKPTFTGLRNQLNSKNNLIGKLIAIPTKKQHTSSIKLSSLFTQPVLAHKRSHPLALRRPYTPPNFNVVEARAQWPQFVTKLPSETEAGFSKRINFKDLPSLKKVPGFSYGVYE